MTEEDKICNDSKCEFNRNGIKHKVSEHNSNSENVDEEFEKAKKISKSEFLIKFDQQTFWKEATGVKNGIVENKKGLEIGKLIVKKKGIGKLEISLIDSSDNLIIKSTQKSALTSKWEIKNVQNNLSGLVKRRGFDWFLFNENEEDILKLEVNQGEMTSPEGKKVAQVFSSAESKRKGLRFFTQYAYKIIIFDEKWNKPILLGFFFPSMIEIHRSGEGL